MTPCRYFDRVFCVFEYSGYVREAIVRYKYFGKSHYYKTFAALLADKLKRITCSGDFNVILSVPLHKHKERKRGYNQSRLISKELSRIMQVPERSELLERIKNTPAQSLLHKNERYLNIKNAFKVTDVLEVKGKSILLIDDVLTTGNTLNECSRVLKEAGAKKVDIAVIAVAYTFEL
ncbi:MAG TPA: ComF family protein [Clostridiales bacterium]|nr:ComF family protein [Clostridiales bacterium]